MPIVFVHGVNNRMADADYKSGVSDKKAFLTSILAPRLGLNPEVVTVQFPYWGDLGVKFRWQQASLPSDPDKYVALALGETDLREAKIAEFCNDVSAQFGIPEMNLSAIAMKGGFAAAVDVAWDAMKLMSPADEADALAEMYLSLVSYVAGNAVPAWVRTSPSLSNSDFVAKLIAESDAYANTSAVGNKVDSYSLNGWAVTLKDRWSRFTTMSSPALTALATRYTRRSVHLKASRFLGDIFAYIESRGDKASPGGIVELVKNEFLLAAKNKKPGDDKLIIIGHSLGGVITYDILTYFAPEIQVDLLITVGSQVALFEEMSFYRSSDKTMTINPSEDRLDKPADVAQWLNVFDTNDVFSFLASPVFNGVEDFRFDTGYGTLGAHGGYFERPSFYKRLADRLTQEKK